MRRTLVALIEAAREEADAEAQAEDDEDVD